MHKISRPTTRRLQCNRHEVHHKYNNDLELYCAKHQIQIKLYSLFPPIHPVTRETTLGMEAVNKVNTEGMIHLEKKFRKLQVVEVLFSDKLAKVGRCIYLWNLVISHKESNMVNTRVIRRAVQKAGLTWVLVKSLASAKHKLSRAW